jgi:hypothetical protein
VPNSLGSRPTLPIHSDTARVLAGRHGGVHTATSREQELPGPLARRLQIIIDGRAGLFVQLELDWLSSLLLSHRCAIRSIATGGDILDPDSNDVAPSKLAVDGQVEHGEIANTAFNLKLGDARA